MSVLTDEIRAACTEIADNQKRIYDLGYKAGRASVKPITFYIYTDWEQSFNAMSGMTWRDYINSGYNSAQEFSIRDGQVYYWDWVIDAKPDEEIVDKGIYSVLEELIVYDGDEQHVLNYPLSSDIESFISSDHNTLGFYFDDDGYVRTPNGKYVYGGAYGDSGNIWIYPEYGYITRYSYSVCEMVDALIVEDKGDVTFTIEYTYSEYYSMCPTGMTWRDYASSRFSDSIIAGGSGESGGVYHDYAAWEGYLTLNGVKVKPDDLIINGATYSGGG